MILLTIIIPAVLERIGHSPVMVKLGVMTQFFPEVEVLALYDNRHLSTGMKRQALLDMAHGKFIACMDDDDDVEPDYIERIVEAITVHPDVDVIAFNGTATLNGENTFTVFTGLDYENEEARKENGLWVDIKRKPWHWCARNALLAKNAKFPDGYIDEDWYWIRQMLPLAKTQHHIGLRPLYHYQYNSSASLSNQGKPTT
jgi:glycosyltransferase involved in cell wall biosynthesis